MAPRDRELPEGTDKIIPGASGPAGNRSAGTGNATGGTGGGASSGFVASGGGNDTGNARSSADGGLTDKLAGQVREQVSSLREQATERVRGFADDGKGRATSMLEDFGAIIDDAARSIDDRLGSDYGEYAHKASDAVSSLARKLRDKSLDDLVEDTRDTVRKSPGIAIGVAAVLGFALVRLVKTGLDDVKGDRGGNSGGGSGGGGRGSRGGGGA